MSLSATGTDPNGDALTYAWDLDNNGTYETPGQTVSFSAASIDGPAMRTVGVRVSDGSATSTDTAQVNDHERCRRRQRSSPRRRSTRATRSRSR